MCKKILTVWKLCCQCICLCICSSNKTKSPHPLGSNLSVLWGHRGYFKRDCNVETIFTNTGKGNIGRIQLCHIFLNLNSQPWSGTKRFSIAVGSNGVEGCLGISFFLSIPAPPPPIHRVFLLVEYCLNWHYQYRCVRNVGNLQTSNWFRSTFYTSS